MALDGSRPQEGTGSRGGVKAAQAWATAEALNLIDNLRRTFVQALKQIAELPKVLKMQQSTRFSLDETHNFLSQLTVLAGKTSASFETTTGEHLLYRISVVKELFRRRVIVKSRLNECVIYTSIALDYHIGGKFFNQETTIWGGAKLALARNTQVNYQAVRRVDDEEDENEGPSDTDKPESGGWGTQ